MKQLNLFEWYQKENAMPKQLTEKQLQIYEFIVNYCKTHNGRPPTYREIGKGCGLKNVSCVYQHVQRIVAKGYFFTTSQGINAESYILL